MDADTFWRLLPMVTASVQSLNVLAVVIWLWRLDRRVHELRGRLNRMMGPEGRALSIVMEIDAVGATKSGQAGRSRDA